MKVISEEGLIVLSKGGWVVIDRLGELRECKGGEGEGEEDEMNLFMLGISFEDENDVFKESKEVNVVLFDVVPI